MQISIKKILLSDIRKASRAMGFDEGEFAHRAFHYYLASIRDELALQQEFKAWEPVSDEALSGLEAQLQEKK